MENKSQCPQCGATSSTKISDTEYHCTYCDSNFTVGMTKEEMIANLLKKTSFGSSSTNLNTIFQTSTTTNTNSADRLAELKAKYSPEALAAMRARGKKIAIIIMVCVFAFVGMILGIVFFSIKSQVKDALATGNWEAPSINKFHVFSGSKGPVMWYILEQSSNGLDSAKFTLRIVNPTNDKVLSEFNFVPVMSWKDGFNSGDFIGDFTSFGDTCWNTTAENGIVARDIYTGKVIVDGKQLGTMYPKFSTGITKASYASYDGKFEVTTNDGFDYYFCPNLKKVFTKDEWDKQRDDKSVTKTFFILPDTKRPQLFKSVEKTFPAAVSSKVYDSMLEDFDPKKGPPYENQDVLSLTQLLPEKTFFNGYVEYSDNQRAIVLYSNSIAKKSALHIACISADGKMLWDISDDVTRKAFQEVFSENNRGVSFVYSKNALILFYQYGNYATMGLDWNTGKVLWNHIEKK